MPEVSTLASTAPEPRHPLVIIGIDGSGKDHVANLIVDATGQTRRRGWLSGRTTTERTTEQKSRRRLLAERVFIRTLPATRHVIPLAMGLLAGIDRPRPRLARRGPHQPASPSIVVSWTPLRVLALAMACDSGTHPKPIPRLTEIALRRTARRHGATALIVNVSDDVLRARLEDRSQRHVADQFDRHLLDHPEFASRFATSLRTLAIRFFPVIELDNDAAQESDVLAALQMPR